MVEDLWELQRQVELDAVHKAEEAYRKSQHEKLQRILSSEIEKNQQDIIYGGKGRPPHYALPILSLYKTTLATIALRMVINRVVDSDDDELPTYPNIAMAIGENCYQEWRQRELAIMQGDKRLTYGLPDLRELLLKKQTSRKRPNQIEKELAEFKNRNWLPHEPLTDFVALGGRVLEILEEIGLIEEVRSLSNGHAIRQVQLSGDLAPFMDQPREDVQNEFLVYPLYLPMLVSPRPWEGTQGGGFLTTENSELNNLVKHRNNASHMEALEAAKQSGQLELVCSAINALQETPWRLNQRIYTVIHYAWSKNILLPGLPDRARLKTVREQLKPLREQLKPLREALREKRQQMNAQKRTARHEEAAAAITSEKNVRKQKPNVAKQKDELQGERDEYLALVKPFRRPLHEYRALQSKILRIKRLLETCHQLIKLGERVDELRFYFPFQLDYRGRAYSMVTSLSPQGNDHERALLEFADGKPLGKKGEFWLAVHIANTYGNNKLSFKDRVSWVKQNAEQISSLAAMINPDGHINFSYITNLPENTRTFWEKADKPWSFLAACLEWQERKMPGFVSHLPIALDASASGFQHLSALSCDKMTAKATNLLPEKGPQDLYQFIANALLKRIEPAAEKGERWALIWKDKDYKDYINRKAVKRGVMTTPYAVTPDGRIKQICDYIEELKGPNPWQYKDPWFDATELARGLGECIEKELPGAIKVMNWLQEVAMTLFEEFGLGVSWTTPAGFPVVVEFYHEREKRIKWTNPDTGKSQEVSLRLPDPKKNLGLNSEKQKSTIAPNFIHSLDAAHMMLTLHRLHSEGLYHFSMIHDSYAVHACDIPIMRRVLKEEFVKMYSDDNNGKLLLKRFLDEQFSAVTGKRSNAPNTLMAKLLKLKETCPPPGELDIKEVLKAQYMFS